MAFERSWPPVLPIALTADGGQWGLVTVSNVAGFRVKQVASLTSNTLPPLPVQVKIVLSPTTLIVGYVDNQIANWKPLNISSYKVADSATIEAAYQQKNKIGVDDIPKAVYEADPVVAIRAIGVDEYGNFYTPDNPLPVAIDGSISISTVEVKGTNGNYIEPNLDGSLNVVEENVSAITPIIYNVPITLSGTEYSQSLPNNTKRFNIQVRNASSKLQIAFLSGESGTNFMSLPRGVSYEVSELLTNNLTVYFQADKPSQIVEILAWT